MEENKNVNSASDNVKKKKPFVNTSGMGEKAKVPSIVKDKFNWGACLLSWIWGLGNKTYITLINLILGFIPFVNIIVAIWFGIKGNEWAWKNKRFKGINQFHENQKQWAIAGVIFMIIFIIVSYFILIGGFVFATAKVAMDNPEKMEKAMEKFENYIDKSVDMYFETYTIEENENKFYISEEEWKYLSFTDRKNLLDLAAQVSASRKEKEYKQNNPEGYQYFSKTGELNKTRIYSADNKNKLLGEFYLDDEIFENGNTSFTDIVKAGMKAYKFYNPNDNVTTPTPRKSYSDNNYYGRNNYREDRSVFIKCYSALNQAINLSYALDGKYITETSGFIDMFTRRMSVISEKTTSNSFTTADNNILLLFQ